MRRALSIFAALLLLLSPAAAEKNSRNSAGIMNVLLCGVMRDENGTRAGVIMILSADTLQGGVRLIAINGDLLAQSGDGVETLSLLYASEGPNGLARILSDVLEADIRNYVTVDMEGFCAAVDSFGGVEIPLDEEEAAALSGSGGETVLPGTATLTGKQAFDYVRLGGRDPVSGGSRQRIFLSAMVDRTLRSPDIGTVLSVAEKLMPYMKTNLNVSDLFRIAISYLAGGMGRLETFVVPADGDYTRAEGDKDGIVLRDEHAAADRFWELVRGAGE